MFFYLFQKSTDDQGPGSSVAPTEYGENLPAQEGQQIEGEERKDTSSPVRSGIRHILTICIK